MKHKFITPHFFAIATVSAMLYVGSHELLLFTMVAALAAMLSAHLLAAQQRRGLQIPLSRTALLALLWLGWLFATTLWSPAPVLSWPYAFTIGTLPFVFLLWLLTAEGTNLWRRYRPWLFGAGLAVAVWGIVQYVLTGKRVTGPMLDFNAYGALLYLFILALLPLLFRNTNASVPSRRRHWGLLAAFAVFCVALFATYSRGAIGVLVVLCVPFYVFAHRRYPKAPKKALVLLLIAVSCYGAVKLYPRHTIDRNWDLAKDSSLQSRLMMWHSMLQIYQQHPWLGTGIATYKIYYRQYRNPKEVESSGDLGHNDYLQFLQEQGPIGLAFLCSTGLFALWVSWRLFEQRDDTDDSDTDDSVGQAFGLSLGVLGLFMQASVNFIFYVQPLALLGGLFLAQSYRTTRPLRYRSIPLPEVSRPVAVMALLCVLGLPVGGLFLDGVSQLIIRNQGNLPGVRELATNPKALYRFATLMEPLRRDNVRLHRVIAGTDLAIASDTSNPPFKRAIAAQNAEQEYIKIINAQGGRDAVALSRFASLVTLFPGIAQDHPFGWPATPENLLRHAIKYDPTFFPAYGALAKLYTKDGKPQKALKLITGQAFRWFGINVTKNVQPQRIALMEQAVKLSLKVDEKARATALAQNLLANDPGNAVAMKALGRAGIRKRQAAG